MILDVLSQFSDTVKYCWSCSVTWQAELKNADAVQLIIRCNHIFLELLSQLRDPDKYIEIIMRVRRKNIRCQLEWSVFLI